MDATAVKAEIKDWEHEFCAQNGRSATIEDVKVLPRMAEKYKLYKKLTKDVERNKGKAKEIQTQPSQGDPPREAASTNPFLTPVKAKHTLSPDTSMPVQNVPSPSARQNTAIVRARKRLRGESVSPSPIPHDKRRRAHSFDAPEDDRHSQTRSVSLPDHNIEEGDSFVDDSPVKAPAGGKAFTPLFEEAMPLSQPPHSKAGNLTPRGRAFSRAKTLPNNLFGHSLAVASTSTATEASRKRTLSNVVEHDSRDERLASNRWRLLPPSPPPPPDDTGRYNAKGKGNGKARDTTQKKNKKAKLSAADREDNREDDTTSSDDVEVKIVSWRGSPHSPRPQETDSTLTIDPELQQFHVRYGAMDTHRRSASASLEKFEVDLPEEMRRILALSHHDVGKEREVEDLVKGLMRGQTRAGGEVWAPGEIGGESEMSDEVAIHGEEDWEGEGVPWEVAEL